MYMYIYLQNCVQDIDESHKHDVEQKKSITRQLAMSDSKSSKNGKLT